MTRSSQSGDAAENLSTYEGSDNILEEDGPAFSDTDAGIITAGNDAFDESSTGSNAPDDNNSNDDCSDGDGSNEDGEDGEDCSDGYDDGNRGKRVVIMDAHSTGSQFTQKLVA